MYFVLGFLIASGLGIYAVTWLRNRPAKVSETVDPWAQFEKRWDELYEREKKLKKPKPIDLPEKKDPEPANSDPEPIVTAEPEEIPHPKDERLEDLCKRLTDLYFARYEPSKNVDIKQEVHKILLRIRAVIKYMEQEGFLKPQPPKKDNKPTPILL